MYFNIYQDYLLNHILYTVRGEHTDYTKTAFSIANLVRYRSKICFFMSKTKVLAIGNAVMVSACPVCLSRVDFPILNVRMDPFPFLGLLG